MAKTPKKLMTPNVVDLGDFTPTKDPEFGNADPYCMCFVYTPTKFVLLKGMAFKVEPYLKANYPKAVYRMTYWKDGRSRGFWRSTLRISFSFDYKNRRHEISIRMPDGTEKLMNVRRIPKKWIPFYDQAEVRHA
jgi:hypothetical protein